MRRANNNDVQFMNLIAAQCKLDPLPDDILDRCLGFVGDAGYFILDPMNSTEACAHVVIAEDGRGKWANQFVRAMFRWAFTSTRIERIYATVAKDKPNISRFCVDAGMRLLTETSQNKFYDIDICRFASVDEPCKKAGGHAASDFVLADHEMVSRLAGACSLMHESGMEHKAWYIYKLYAKLFGYRAEG